MTINGYTRVSTILQPFSGLDKIDPAIVQHAADRGTKVHRICEAIILGLGEIDVDDETFGYVHSFKQWWAPGHSIVKMEHRFRDDLLMVTGQIDLIIDSPEGLSVVDFKTSYRPSKTWPVQGAAYAYLASKSGLQIANIQFIHLNKKGLYPTIYHYPVDHGLFCSVFHTWQHFYQEKTNDDQQSV